MNVDSKERRVIQEVLQGQKFVRIDGLRYYVDGVCRGIIVAGEHHLGKWDFYQGLTIVVTAGGEIWVKSGPPPANSNLLQSYAPRGKGVYIPVGHSGIKLSTHDVQRRYEDPNWMSPEKPQGSITKESEHDW